MAASGLSRTDLLAAPERELSEETRERLNEWLRRRLAREPLPYITGWQEFYGRRFHVDRRVLIPRPESEALVEQALAFARERLIANPLFADIGTGSGALAVTLACELPAARVIATDLSVDALDVARANAIANGVSGRVEFRRGDLTEPFSERCDIIVCNPPYVLAGFLDGPESQPELAFEPRSALDGGPDGMDVYRPLISGLPVILKPSNSAAYIEIDPPVAAACVAAAKTAFPGAEVAALTDLAGLERCLAIEIG